MMGGTCFSQYTNKEYHKKIPTCFHNQINIYYYSIIAAKPPFLFIEIVMEEDFVTVDSLCL